MKKLLLSFVMMLTATAAAWADYTVIGGIGYYFSKSDYSYPTEGYPDGYVAYVQSLEEGVYSGEINIPSAISYEGEQYPVVKIDQSAFKDATVTKVTIPATVQVIENYAFENCANLTSIDLPEGLKSIGMSAFEYCPITSMTIPGTVTYISGYALPTSLTSLTLSAGEETLAFVYPAVGMRDDVSITDLNIDRNYHYDNMPLSDKVKRVTFGSHVTTIDRSAFEGCTLEHAITLPSSIKEIGNGAFQNCTVPAITLNEGLETINNYAFYGCTATFNGLPSTLTSIGERAFQGTIGLKTANIPSGVTKLEGYTFIYSAVETVTIPGSITEVNRYEFSECQNLKTVTIENGATSLDIKDIFDNCDNVETMNIDRNFTVDSSNPAFSRTAQMTVNLGSHVTEIPLYAFQECSFTALTIPGTVKYVRGYSLPTTLTSLTLLAGEETLTFDAQAMGSASAVSVTDLYIDRNYAYTSYPLSRQVKRVTFGNHVTTIDKSAFDGCTLEQAITLPSSLKEIGYNAFQNCTVPAITLNEGLETIGQNAFKNCTATFNGIPSTLTSIGQSAFSQCTGLTGDLVIPAGVTQLAMSTFYGTGITSVTIPGTVTKINTSDFGNCANLKTVTLLSGAAPLTIGKRCFYQSLNITDVTIDRDFTYYNDLEKNRSPFNTAIERVTFGSNVTRVGDRALASCRSLTDVVLPDNITTVGIEAFKWSEAASLTLSKNLTTVEYCGFYGMIGSASLTLPISLNDVGQEAFYNITNLKGVYVPWIDAPIALTHEDENVKTFSYGADQTLWVPGGTLDKYQAADGWKRFQNFDYWSFVVTADLTGKGTLAIANGETVTDNGTNTALSLTGAKLVEEGAGEAVSGLFVREKDLVLAGKPARGYEMKSAIANGEELTVSKDTAIVSNLLADQTLKATFAPIIYKLTIDLAGGVLAEGQSNPTTYTVEDEAITLVNPTREGYTFEGWTGTGIEGTAMEVTIPASSIGDRAFTAIWAPITYNLTYDLAGGEMGADNTNPATYTIESEDITLAAPTKTGYTFTGWTGTGLTEATLEVVIAKGSTGDRTYTATWKANSYKVRFMANGGEGEMADQPFTYDEAQQLTANAFTRNGYTFFVWNRKADGSGKTYRDQEEVKNLSSKADGTVALFAQWRVITYNISYDLAGGTVDGENPTEYTVESDITLINPTKDCYDFAGWTGTGLEGPTMEVVISKGSTGDRAYTATWELKQYAVTIEPTENGTVEASTLTPKHGEQVVITVKPAENYVLASLIVNGEDVTEQVVDGQYTIENVTSDITVEAVFAATFIKGDVNNDGSVGIGDIVAITNVMAGINKDPDTAARADVNNDGSVGIGDIVAVTNIMAGIK